MANPIIGNIDPPLNNSYFTGAPGAGLFLLLNNLFRLVAVIAGIYAIFQLISAGYMFMSANGDPKAFEKGWNKIWQAIIGLLVVAGAFVLAAVIGRFLQIDILNPIIYGPL